MAKKVFNCVCYICIAGMLFGSGEAFAYHEECARLNALHKQSRFELYFARGGAVNVYKTMVNVLDDCHPTSIGLVTGTDSYQYPLLAEYAFNGVKVSNLVLEKHVDDEDDMSDCPQCIVFIDRQMMPEEILMYNGKSFACIYMEEDSHMFSVWKQI